MSFVEVMAVQLGNARALRNGARKRMAAERCRRVTAMGRKVGDARLLPGLAGGKRNPDAIKQGPEATKQGPKPA